MKGHESYDPFGYYFEYCFPKTIDSFHIASRILPNVYSSCVAAYPSSEAASFTEGRDLFVWMME